jgi:hypothetical protein
VAPLAQQMAQAAAPRANYLEVDKKKMNVMDFSRICRQPGSEEEEDDQLPELEPIP